MRYKSTLQEMLFLLSVCLMMAMPSVVSAGTCTGLSLDYYGPGNPNACGNRGYNECLNRYVFGYDVNTAQIHFDARQCYWNYAQNLCWTPTASYPRCEPPCALRKFPGPSGQFCSDFNVQSSCAMWYADHNGDRWCWWDNSTNTCHDSTYTCHD